MCKKAKIYISSSTSPIFTSSMNLEARLMSSQPPLWTTDHHLCATTIIISTFESFQFAIYTSGVVHFVSPAIPSLYFLFCFSSYFSSTSYISLIFFCLATYIYDLFFSIILFIILFIIFYSLFCYPLEKV